MENFYMFWQAILAIAIIPVLILIIRHYAKIRLYNKIPGPKYNIIFGNALQLHDKNEDHFTALCKLLKQFQTSPVVRIWLGSVPRIYAVKASSAEVILSNTKKLLQKRLPYKFMIPWIGYGLLTSDGTKWHKRRKLITPTFHYRILEDFLPVFQEQAEILASILDNYVDEEAFDICPFLTRCTLDIICETAMGKKVSAQTKLNSEYVHAVKEMAEIVSLRIVSPWIHSDWSLRFTSYWRRQNEALKILHSFTNKVINERKQQFLESERNKNADQSKENSSVFGMKKRKAFLDLLLETNTSDGNFLSDEDIREEVDTFMFEGHDTTASSLQWVLYNIGRLPEVQQKIHEELDAIFGKSDRPITSEDIKEMKYLECVIKETLRLYPPVPAFSREVIEDFNLCGYKIPAGATLSINVFLIHHDPDVYPDPHKFDPDRFLRDNCVSRHPYAFVPFSAGPRNCIGQKFAIMEEKVVLSTIMRRFKVTSVQNHDLMKPTARLILQAPNGVRLKLQHHND